MARKPRKSTDASTEQQRFDQLLSALIAVKKSEAYALDEKIKTVRKEIDKRKKQQG